MFVKLKNYFKKHSKLFILIFALSLLLNLFLTIVVFFTFQQSNQYFTQTAGYFEGQDGDYEEIQQDLIPARIFCDGCDDDTKKIVINKLETVYNFYKSFLNDYYPGTSDVFENYKLVGKEFNIFVSDGFQINSSNPLDNLDSLTTENNIEDTSHIIVLNPFDQAISVPQRAISYKLETVKYADQDKMNSDFSSLFEEIWHSTVSSWGTDNWGTELDQALESKFKERTQQTIDYLLLMSYGQNLENVSNWQEYLGYSVTGISGDQKVIETYGEDSLFNYVKQYAGLNSYGLGLLDGYYIKTINSDNGNSDPKALLGDYLEIQNTIIESINDQILLNKKENKELKFIQIDGIIVLNNKQEYIDTYIDYLIYSKFHSEDVDADSFSHQFYIKDLFTEVMYGMKEPMYEKWLDDIYGLLILNDLTKDENKEFREDVQVKMSYVAFNLVASHNQKARSLLSSVQPFIIFGNTELTSDKLFSYRGPVADLVFFSVEGRKLNEISCDNPDQVYQYEVPPNEDLEYVLIVPSVDVTVKMGLVFGYSWGQLEENGSIIFSAEKNRKELQDRSDEVMFENGATLDEKIESFVSGAVREFDKDDVIAIEIAKSLFDEGIFYEYETGGPVIDIINVRLGQASFQFDGKILVRPVDDEEGNYIVLINQLEYTDLVALVGLSCRRKMIEGCSSDDPISDSGQIPGIIELF